MLKDDLARSFVVVRLTRYVFLSLLTLTSGSCCMMVLFTGVFSYNSYRKGRAIALRVILYFLISVPDVFLRLTVNEPSLMGDFRFISKMSFWSYLLEGSSLSSMSLMFTCSFLRTIEALGVVSFAA
jgi:hypothetical protein